MNFSSVSEFQNSVLCILKNTKFPVLIQVTNVMNSRKFYFSIPFGCCWAMHWIFPPPSRISRAGTLTTLRICDGGIWRALEYWSALTPMVSASNWAMTTAANAFCAGLPPRRLSGTKAFTGLGSGLNMNEVLSGFRSKSTVRQTPPVLSRSLTWRGGAIYIIGLVAESQT